MTERERMFKEVFFDKWYFWDESWAVCHGPYEDYTAAHSALTKHIEKAKEHNGLTNCQGS